MAGHDNNSTCYQSQSETINSVAVIASFLCGSIAVMASFVFGSNHVLIDGPSGEVMENIVL